MNLRAAGSVSAGGKKVENLKLRRLRRKELLKLAAIQQEEISDLKRQLSQERGEAFLEEERNGQDELQQRLSEELQSCSYRSRFIRAFYSTACLFLTMAAIAVLISSRFLPVLRICGSSMTPAVSEKDIVVSVKGIPIQRGDVIAFYYNNQILVKRVIAKEGEWVNIDKEGNVSIDGVLLTESYVTEKSLEPCTLEFPCQVPGNRLFVLGDQRPESADSRDADLGFVSQEQVIGSVVFRIWPLSRIGVL